MIFTIFALKVYLTSVKPLRNQLSGELFSHGA